MDKYLTTKVKPGSMLLLAENAAVLLLAAALVCWGSFAVVGLMIDGFVPEVHILMMLLATPFVLLICWLLGRKQMRKHARAIISALLVSGKAEIPCGELEEITGIKRCAALIAKLTAKQYVRDVAVIRGEVRLVDQAYKQAVCTYCGAALTFRTERIDKCPSCGSSAIKY